MVQALPILINGGTDVEILVYNGIILTHWVITDFNQLLGFFQEFDTQLNRKLTLLNILRSILSYMQTRI